jgi:hypothetical protein
MGPLVYRTNINMYTVLAGNLQERGYLEDLSVDGRIILKRILKK